VLRPALEPVYVEMRRTDPAAANLAEVIGDFGFAVGVILQLAYATAVLIVMLVPSVSKAFRGEAGPADDRDEEAEDRPDYYDDRYER
jgi:hypothetical protein